MKLNELDLNKLHVFLILTQKGTMKEAAKELLRTPSAISQSLSRLESSLGAQLFRRVGTRLILTDEGRELAQGLARYQSDLGQLLSRLSSHQQELSGTVRLGLPPGFPAARVGETLERFLCDAPRAQLRLRFLSHAELAEGLSQGSIDLALSLAPLDRLNRNLLSSKLFDEELVLVSSGATRVSSRIPSKNSSKNSSRISGEKLTTLSVIEYYQAPSVFDQWVQYHFPKGTSVPPARVYAATLEYVLELVRRGVGVAVVPYEAVAAEIELGTLREIRPPRSQRWKGAVWLNEAKSAYMSPACARFRNQLSEFR